MTAGGLQGQIRGGIFADTTVRWLEPVAVRPRKTRKDPPEVQVPRQIASTQKFHRRARKDRKDRSGFNRRGPCPPRVVGKRAAPGPKCSGLRHDFSPAAPLDMGGIPLRAWRPLRFKCTFWVQSGGSGAGIRACDPDPRPIGHPALAGLIIPRDYSRPRSRTIGAIPPARPAPSGSWKPSGPLTPVPGRCPWLSRRT